MNVCLVTNSPSGTGFRSPVIDELAGLGFRIVVVFLQPQPRMLWNQGNVVFYSPYTRFGKQPLEISFRQKLDLARDAWRAPIKDGTGPAFRLVRGLERRSYIAVRYIGTRAAGRVGAAIGKARAKLTARLEKRDPFQNIPQGESAYGVYHALDHESVTVAQAAAVRTGAKFFGPGEPALRERYEAAIMHWLQV